MPHLTGIENPSYDFVVYALQCDFVDTRPKIDQKYLTTKSSDDLTCLYPVSDQFLVPKGDKEHPGTQHWKVVDENGQRSYPLYIELAAEAKEVYYVGSTTSGLKQRIKQHFQPSRKTVFLEETDGAHLSKIRWYSIDVDAETLLEGLESELHTELKSTTHDRRNLIEEYREMASKIQNSNTVTYSDVNRWKREVNRSTSNRYSFAAINSYLSQVNRKTSEKEDEMASKITKFHKERYEDGILPENIERYAYWN
ncbi:GIY-YIG nuclease family protein [Natronoarchaeum mannanilyticum]|uniref:GIY-YIG domain-containing protein n=1 Tax=Natronoarchaeum mannanilyticum TaxID=926360 RepID=A0AAV3TAZ5_9EURY